jgi:hypothetical protein
MRCCIRLQHSAAAESPRWSAEEDDPPMKSPVNRDQRQRRHPPRPPRTYVARRGRDVELKSFGFMNQVGRRSGFTERAQTDRPSDERIQERSHRQPVDPELRRDIKQVAEVCFSKSALTI